MADATLQEAYDNAAAVFSRSFRFVEWKFVRINKTVAYPFGDDGEPAHKATKAIDRKKWIYVFRHGVGETFAELQEEIEIDESGEMLATPHSRLDAPIKGRGQAIAIGKTLCLPRRIFGTRRIYRILASRVRLPSAQIKALKEKIHRLVPETSLEPGVNTSVVEKDGEWLVPVVDPITVLLHLHAAYVSAADDVVNYTIAHKGLSSDKRAIVTRRHKKHLLATILKAIIGDKSNTNANNLVHELRDMQYPLEEFLTHYEQAVAWRVRLRVRLGADLVRWLESDILRITEDAFRQSPREKWGVFLLPWCHAITRLPEVAAGREYLVRLLAAKDHFVHDYVWPKVDITDDAFQFVRKSGLTILEAWKTIAEAQVLLKEGDFVNETLTTLRRLTRERVELKTSRLTMASIARMKGVRGEIMAEVSRIGSLKLTDVPDHAPDFGGAAKTVGFVIESVNLLFAVKAVSTAMKGEDDEAKTLAVVGLVGSSLDAGSALASLFKNTERFVAVMGFVSGVIDIYLGHIAMDKAFKDGDENVAGAAFLTAAGATIGVSSVCMGLLAIPGGQIVGMIGLAIVAIGSIMRAMLSKSDLEIFFAHCSWGLQHKKAGGADWSPTRFEQWTGASEFDYQLDALLNILCKIEIDRGDSAATVRELTFKVGWIPPDATLMVRYAERWQRYEDSRELEAKITFSKTGPVSNNPKLPAASGAKSVVKVSDKEGLAVGTIDAGLPDQQATTRPRRLYYEGPMRVWMPHPELKEVVAEARLSVTLEGGHAFTIPHSGWARNRFYEA